MRMWMVDPRLLCRKHLLGEHGEIHKHRWCFERGHRMDKRVETNAIEPGSMEKRHDELAAEMCRRGYRHNSPYEQPDLAHYSDRIKSAVVDKAASLVMLLDRCPDCRENSR